jgi:hypothetical protein
LLIHSLQVKNAIKGEIVQTSFAVLYISKSFAALLPFHAHPQFGHTGVTGHANKMNMAGHQSHIFLPYAPLTDTANC